MNYLIIYGVVSIVVFLLMLFAEYYKLGDTFVDHTAVAIMAFFPFINLLFGGMAIIIIVGTFIRKHKGHTK